MVPKKKKIGMLFRPRWSLHTVTKVDLLKKGINQSTLICTLPGLPGWNHCYNKIALLTKRLRKSFIFLGLFLLSDFSQIILKNKQCSLMGVRHTNKLHSRKNPNSCLFFRKILYPVYVVIFCMIVNCQYLSQFPIFEWNIWVFDIPGRSEDRWKVDIANIYI